MDILNVASPRDNDYNGDFSEKSVIIHAINYFKINDGPTDLGSIFFNISIPSQRRLISSTIFSSPIFIDKTTKSDLWGQVDIANDYKRLVITKDPEFVYNESIKPKETERPEIVLNQNKYFIAGRDIKDQSSLSNDFSSNKMNEIIKSDKSQYPGFVKISRSVFIWIISHIVQILIGLLIGFLIFKFGWN